jgi:hypothetical protein
MFWRCCRNKSVSDVELKPVDREAEGKSSGGDD